MTSASFPLPARAVSTALLIGSLIALAAGLSAIQPAAGATAFVIRGDVTKFDKANSNFHVYFRHTNSAAEKFAGEVHEINASPAKFYKYDSKQKKIASTFGSTIDDDGIEVVVEGTFDDSNVFKATKVTRNDNTVKLRGTVRGQSVSNNYLDVEIDKVLYQATGKDYKSTIFKKGERILVYYDEDSTKFKSRDGKAMNEDEISNNDEKVTIESAQVKYGSRFEANASTTITDGKWLF